jgi:hypothetical protein
MSISLLALFIALGTGAYAPITVPANSVGTQQLKNATGGGVSPWRCT